MRKPEGGRIALLLASLEPCGETPQPRWMGAAHSFDGIETSACDVVDFAFGILEATGVGGAGIVEFQGHRGLGLVNGLPKLDVDETWLRDPVVPFPLLMKLPVRVEKHR